MSRYNLIEYILKSEANEADTMDEMDAVLDDNSDFMRSDFFDSVMSMEGPNGNEAGLLENTYLDNVGCVQPPGSESSSHLDEVQSNNSLSLDSDKWNEIPDSPPIIKLPEEMFFPFIDEAKVATKPAQPRLAPNKIIVDKVKGKKLYVTKLNTGYKKTRYNNKQVLRVQSLSGNGQPLLLPFSDVKRIKIVNASDLKAETIGLSSANKIPVQMKKDKLETYSVTSTSSDFTEDDVEVSETGQYPALVLTNEEKRLLDKDGIQLPTHYPLTKNEERELKRIRRKIRNKISAQDSRKRKKEYVDGLEERVKRGSEENKFLLKRIKQLQNQNSRLMAQMSKLQSILFNNSASKVTPSTCLMIVLFSALLVSLPNLRTSNEKELGDMQQIAARRALLFSQQATNEEDTLNMEEFLLFNKDDELDNLMEDGADENETSTEKESFNKFIAEAEKKFGNEQNYSGGEDKGGGGGGFFEVCNKFEEKIKHVFNTINHGLFAADKHDYGAFITKHGFLEPDIDDEPGPPKKIKLNAAAELKEKQVDEFNDNVISATLNSAYKLSESKKQ